MQIGRRRRERRGGQLLRCKRQTGEDPNAVQHALLHNQVSTFGRTKLPTYPDGSEGGEERERERGFVGDGRAALHARSTASEYVKPPPPPLACTVIGNIALSKESIVFSLGSISLSLFLYFPRARVRDFYRAG